MRSVIALLFLTTPALALNEPVIAPHDAESLFEWACVADAYLIPQ